MPTPVQIQAPRVCIDLHRNAVLRAGAKDLLHADVVAWPPKQLSAGHMTQDGRSGVRDRLQDAIRLLLSAQFEAAVYAGHDEIKSRQHILRIIQRSVRKNTDSMPFRIRNLFPVVLVQPIDLGMLLEKSHRPITRRHSELTANGRPHRNKHIHAAGLLRP